MLPSLDFNKLPRSAVSPSKKPHLLLFCLLKKALFYSCVSLDSFPKPFFKNPYNAANISHQYGKIGLSNCTKKI